MATVTNYFKSILFTTLLVATTSQQVIVNIRTPDYISSVVFIRYNLTEEKLPKLIENEILSIPIDEVDNVISLQEFLGFIKVQQLSIDNLQVLLQELDLKKYININTLEHVLNIPSLNLTPTFELFLKNFSIDLHKDLTGVLDVFNIDSKQFFTSYYTHNEEALLDAVKKGKFTLENFKKALNVINKTEEEMFEFIKQIALEGLQGYSMKDMLICFSVMGVKAPIANIISINNLTKENFFENLQILNLLEKFEENIKAYETLGVKINRNHILTHEKVFTKSEKLGDFVVPYAEFIDNHEIISVENIDIKSEGVALVVVKDYDGRSAKIADDYSMVLHDCVYLTMNETGVNLNYVNINFNNVTNLYVTKSNTTNFQLGGPVFCNDAFYGLADREDEINIYFSSFPTVVKNEPENVINKSSSVLSCAYVISASFLAMYVYMFL